MDGYHRHYHEVSALLLQAAAIQGETQAGMLLIEESVCTVYHGYIIAKRDSDTLLLHLFHLICRVGLATAPGIQTMNRQLKRGAVLDGVGGTAMQWYILQWHSR